ncbi:MAG: glutamate--tRNA ligase [Bacilli bacterium]
MREKLANLIFPEINKTIKDLEKEYPKRKLIEGAEVTRFAPSPTGFLHTGSLFTALVAKTVANQSKGIFFVRLEDTDTKREIAGAGETLLKEMNLFDVFPDEGYMGEKEEGVYGPYKQSERAAIYKTVIKEMIKDDLAYPCFCTNHDLSALRATQEANKVVPGYYGAYARCSFLSAEEAINRINNGENYVLRFRSKGNHENKISFNDVIKGTIEIAENDQHIVILKSDGLPTYHFAHLCDDHFMHTTLVTRGEEWISSVPLHLELFKALKFNTPRYAHLPVINKLDNGNKRKLSKRKDPEAAVTYFLNLGYPIKAILTYLMSIANSNFEEWWAENREKPLSEFPFSISKMSVVGALFDIEKVNFFAREYIASLTAKEVVDEYLAYALYNKNEKLVKRIKDNYDLFVQILNIEREGEKPRKDYHNYSMVYPSIKFFFSDEFAAMHEDFDIGEFKESLSKDTLIGLLESFKTELTYGEGNSVWFDSLKKVAEKHGFAINNKAYRTNPELYNGNVADCAEVLRLAIVLSKKSLNLYEVLSILGPKEVEKRLTAMQNKLK